MKGALEELRQLWPDRIVLTWDPFNFDEDEPPYWLLVLWVERGSSTGSGSSVHVKHDADPEALVNATLQLLRNGTLNYQAECQKYNARQKKELATDSPNS